MYLQAGAYFVAQVDRTGERLTDGQVYYNRRETTMSYIDLMKEKARSDRKTIVLPETNDKRTLIAAANILKEKIADIIMVGNEEKIMDGAGWLEVELDGVTIIDPEKSEKLDQYTELLYETRKIKA